MITSVAVFEEVLATGNPNWRHEAEDLARSGAPFFVNGFHNPGHQAILSLILLEYKYTSRIDPANCRIYFWPPIHSSRTARRLPDTASQRARHLTLLSEQARSHRDWLATVSRHSEAKLAL